MHAGSALHVVGTSFVSDYGTWFCFFLLSSCVFLAVSLCAWSVLTTWVWLHGRCSVPSAGMEVASASLVPTLGKNFPQPLNPPRTFLPQTRFSPQWLTFIQGAQKTCQIIIEGNRQNSTAISPQGMTIDIFKTTIYHSKEFSLNVFGSVWLALQKRNYLLSLAVFDGAYSPRTEPVRTSCLDAHHFNV